jgi:acetoacetyl-CoA synthetase
MSEGTLLWEPPDELVQEATLTRFRHWVAEHHDVEVPDYQALWQWSVDDLEAFWGAIWEFFDVQAATPYERVLGDRSMPGAQWFPGAELSYPAHIVRDRDPDAVALVHASELRDVAETTWGELLELTGRIQAGLRRLGVERGDRVVAYMPNISETVAAFLAVSGLGAVWSSCSPDFGARSVVDRFAQVEPKVLLAVDGYRYNGRDFDRRETVDRLRAEMGSLAAIVLIPYLGSGELEGTMTWADLTAEPAEPEWVSVPFDHPLWILYSSGTTGLPKAIVQGHGGILVEQLKKAHLHLDAREGDRVFWFTTTGWMMWNFIIGALLTPAAIVLYDGSPGHPDLGALWDLAEQAGVTIFGTSAGYIASCMKADLDPAAGRDLSRLRAVGSTGSPLAPEAFEWIYEKLGRDTWLFNTSGGTDLCTAFVGGVPVLPVYRGELQARSLGAAVAAFDEQGEPVIDEVGELVITEPMPSMPLYLWNDPDGERYRESYFDMFPGVWRHGDWIEITSRNTAKITGRSDSTINRGGVRMGTSEIYRAVLALDEIVDALVVDVDGWMPLFVVLRDGAELDEELEKAIATRIREDCSPRHVPNEVHAVAEVPRTLSGKVLEVPVKKILQGGDPEKVASRDSLGNPEALDWFVAFAGRHAAAS